MKLIKTKKLLELHWLLIKNNVVLWLLTSICILVQPFLILLFEILNISISDNTLLLFLIPNLLFVILVIFLTYILFQSNKDNSIDNKLLCSVYNKHKIKIIRFSFIWIILISIILCSDLFLIYFPIKQKTILGLLIFLCNTLITPLIFLLITIFFVYLSIKTSKATYLLITILFSIVTLGLSALIRPLTYKNELGSNNYYKLLTNNNEFLVEHKKDETNLNNQIFKNTFVPSEWFYSLYSWVFQSDNNYSNSLFSLRSIQYSYSNQKILDNENTPFMIRSNDLDFLKLSNHDYLQIIIKDIKKIVNKYNLAKNILLVNQLIDYINNNFDWNKINNTLITDILIDLTGINTEFNQLYYLIKYQKSINLNIGVLLNNITQQFNDSISNLIKTLLESEHTFYNLFKLNNKFNSLQIYPNYYIIDNSKNIVENDNLFLKNKLIKFNNNLVYFLNNDFVYNKFDLSILSNYNNDIIDENTYKTFIDGISLNYKTTKNFIDYLKNNLNTMLDYKLSNNAVDPSSIYNLYKLESHSNLYYLEIFIGLFFMANIFASALFFTKIKN